MLILISFACDLCGCCEYFESKITPKELVLVLVEVCKGGDSESDVRVLESTRGHTEVWGKDDALD